MDNQSFYIIQPIRLVFDTAGMSLQQRRDRLGELVRTYGAEWAGLRMRGADFMTAVEKIDLFMGAGDELTNCAFENSPNHVLPAGSAAQYNPLFGYYEPNRVREFDQQLRAMPPAVIQRWEAGPNGEVIAQVVHAFRSSFAEAAKREYAVALEHG